MADDNRIDVGDETALVEAFRKALMVKHADDWDMDTISEAAHICAATFFGRDVER